MANLYRFLTIALFIVCFPVFAAEPGEIDLAGWIKNESGTYAKAFSDSNGTSRVTLNSPPTGLSTTSTAMVQTSKGLQPFDITKTADVDVSRVGKAVRGLAVLGGPVGMAVTAVSLVCELTNICNQAGQWFMQQDPAYAGYPETTTNVYFSAPAFPAQTKAPTKEMTCSKLGTMYSTSVTYNSSTNKCVGSGVNSDITQHGGCAPGYTLSGSNCNLNSVSHAPTQSDWDSKESLLNDSRFVPELFDKGLPLPTSGIPTLNADQKKRLGVDTEPTKDSAGNVTGRQETITSIEAVDAGTTANPGRVIIKETKTTIKYDNSNTQISSDTATSYSSQPQTENKPQTFEIKFDEVPPAELPTHNVQATFSSTSWGEGTCPPDIDVALSGVGQTFTIPTEPICSTAEMINPFILLLASIAGIYIVSGVRSTEAK